METATVQNKKPGRPWVWAGVGCLLLVCLLMISTGFLAIYSFMPQIIEVLDPLPTRIVIQHNLGTATPASGQFPQEQENAVGNPTAPVQIIIYSDFQCPYCQDYWRNTEKRLIRDYVATGKVHLIYRSMGDFLGSESQAAAEAAYCAGDQGRFWEYHDVLFAHQTGENVGDFATANLVAYAKAIDLDSAAFQICLVGGKYKARAKQDQIDGQAAGVLGTPTFFVNGKMVRGSVSYATLRGIIEAILADKINT